MAAYPELNGRVVAITGAASGIGAVAAREFAAQGARVALVDIARDDAEALAADEADIAQLEEMEKAAKGQKTGGDDA